jgi:hypothetical protein
VLRLAGVVVVVGGLLLGVSAAASTSAASSIYSAPLIEFWDGASWTQQVGPDPDGSGRLTAVVALSTTDVWALGSYGGDTKFGNALAEHWDGSSWQQVAIPTPAGANEVHLYGVAAISVTNIWAVGSWAGTGTGGGYDTLIEHWDGSSWAIVPSPSPGISAQIYGVAVLSKTNVWAVGYSESSAFGFARFRTLVLHWNGNRWRRVASPHPGPPAQWDSRLSGVAAVSPRDVWAVGSYNRVKPGHRSHPTLVLHWNGKKWKQVPSPSRGHSSYLVAAAAVGRKSVWAVGYWQKSVQPKVSDLGRCLVEHWNGHSWRVVPASGTPEPYSGLNSLTVLAGNDIWAAGQQFQASYDTLSEHWDGTAWSAVPGPNPAPDKWLSGIAAATPTAVWAVGTYFPAGS